MTTTALLIMDVQQGIVERFARDRGYLDRLADGCLDADPEVHEILLGKVFPRQAEVTTIADWADRLCQPAPRADQSDGTSRR